MGIIFDFILVFIIFPSAMFTLRIITTVFSAAGLLMTHISNNIWKT